MQCAAISCAAYASSIELLTTDVLAGVEVDGEKVGAFRPAFFNVRWFFWKYVSVNWWDLSSNMRDKRPDRL